ncbi:hypothetical protein TeGR_g6948 [Tetraparma gracilis]|uniref:Uncharacterized protein n=1 Tax=Tetraparma gracilis TaxID=2962635 RepID=A0ABQ6MDI9_9STRA|nr:hypothetical protein TeGR_g6948 [Tetraparma gracilis]
MAGAPSSFAFCPRPSSLQVHSPPAPPFVLSLPPGHGCVAGWLFRSPTSLLLASTRGHLVVAACSPTEPWRETATYRLLPPAAGPVVSLSHDPLSNLAALAARSAVAVLDLSAGGAHAPACVRRGEFPGERVRRVSFAGEAGLIVGTLEGAAHACECTRGAGVDWAGLRGGAGEALGDGGGGWGAGGFWGVVAAFLAFYVAAVGLPAST